MPVAQPVRSPECSDRWVLNRAHTWRVAAVKFKTCQNREMWVVLALSVCFVL